MSDDQNRTGVEAEEGYALLEGPPSVGWVIHEVPGQREADGVVWAWCKVGVEEPGYTDIVFTARDGSTIVNGPTNLVLGAVITKLWC